MNITWQHQRGKLEEKESVIYVGLLNLAKIYQLKISTQSIKQTEWFQVCSKRSGTVSCWTYMFHLFNFTIIVKYISDSIGLLGILVIQCSFW